MRKHWLYTFLIFKYTHSYKLLLEHTRGGNHKSFPSLKGGSVRVDKASLTQYVNDSISEVNHVGTQMANRRALDSSHEEDYSLAKS